MSTKKTPHQLHDFQHDAVELERRIADAELNYSVRCDGPDLFTRQFAHGAQIRVFNDQPLAFLQEVAEKLKEGFELYEPAGVDMQASHGARFIACELTKPRKVQQAELKAIHAQVEAAYTSERRERYEAHLAAVAAETVLRLERAAVRAAEEARVAALAAATKEAADAVGEFV